MSQDYKDKRIAEFREKFVMRDSSVESFLYDTIDECTAAAVAGERKRIRELSENHYWDTFQDNKKLILAHVEFLLTPPPSTSDSEKTS